MSKHIFIAGGGTGGHIYPGVAIAKALKSLNQDVQVHFVGTPKGFEKEIIPREGLPLHFVNIGKLNYRGQWISKLKTLLQLPGAFIESIRLLWRYKPVFVLGVGGYASGPFVLVASLLGFNTGIWEPNALPGLANRWLSRFVDVAFLVFEKSKHYIRTRRIFIYGLPLRPEVEAQALGSKNKEKDLRKDKLRILCFGGSQGARAINQVFSQVLLERPEWEAEYEVVHQIGKNDWAELSPKYQGLKTWVRGFEFIFDMPEYYKWADIAICRAGASALAEVTAYGLVPIMIPLPLADGHQEANARSISERGGGVLLLQKDLTPARLIAEIERLKQEPELRQTMGQSLKAMYQPHAADKIARQIMELSQI